MTGDDVTSPEPAAAASPVPPADAGRREVLGRIALVAGAAIGAASLLGPAGVALSPLVRPADGASTGAWQRLDSVSRFAIGAPPVRVVLRRDVRDQWLLRRGDTLGAVLVERLAEADFRVLSSVCPHLGCAVVWNEQGGQWRCPCHKSAFARDGALVPATSGPPNPSPRALDPLEWRIAGDALEVRWVRFKTGISDRVPLGATTSDSEGA